MRNVFDELNPPPRRLMGPGPVDADPRVLRAMSMPLLGQFDPAFTSYMNEVMALYRQVLRTGNRWTFLVDGTARAGIEAAMVSLLAPGDRVLVPIFGRFGHLLCEVATRCGADVRTIETEWGTVFEPGRIAAAVREHRPALVAIVHGDTSTTMAQPLAEIGAICREHDTLLYVDATATVGGMDVRVDDWSADILSTGPPEVPRGAAGVGAHHVQRAGRSPGAVAQAHRAGDPPGRLRGGGGSRHRLELLRPRDADGLLEREPPQPPHRGDLDALRGARVRPHRARAEGLDARFERHARASRALVAGLDAMGLERFGDRDPQDGQRHRASRSPRGCPATRCGR